MYNYNFYIVIMENCDITELYKLVWQFPYPMVTPVIGYKENKEIDWLIDIPCTKKIVYVMCK